MSLLNDEAAMHLAAQWYNRSGPFAGTYVMQPLRAWRAKDLSYCIRFRVEPDVGKIYHRQFNFAQTEAEDEAFSVTGWSEELQLPPGASIQDGMDMDDDDSDLDVNEMQDELAGLQDSEDEDEAALAALRARLDAAHAAEQAEAAKPTPSGLPDPHPDPQVPSTEPMTPEQACQLAAHWYDSFGPYRHMYRLKPVKAFQNSPSEFSVRFKVEPDTGFLYFRRFKFGTSESELWYCQSWSEDPAIPDGVDYADLIEPDQLDQEESETDSDDEDDEGDVQAEHGSTAGGRDGLKRPHTRHNDSDDEQDELAALHADAEEDIEALRAKYGYGVVNSEHAAASHESVAPSSTSGEPRPKRVRVGPHATETTVAPSTDGSLTASASATDSGSKATDKTESLREGNGTLEASSAVKDPAEEHSLEGAMQKPARAATQNADLQDDDEDDDDDDDDEFDPTIGETAHMADYFRTAIAEGLELDLPTGPAKHVESRTGVEYQAVVPPLDVPNCVDKRFLELSTPTWLPRELDQQALDAFLRLARAGKMRSDEAAWIALRVLTEQQGDFELAKAALGPALRADMPREFTFHELDMFEIGLSAFGKNFPAIQRRYLSHRSVREVVRCYYDWKRTPRYDLWVMVSGFHGEQRRKHRWDPGTFAEPSGSGAKHLLLSNQEEALIEQIAESVERSRSPHALPSNLTLGDATLETASEWVASADTLTAASDQTSGAPDPAKATLAVTAGLLSSPRHNTGDADVDIDFLSPIKDLESIAGSLASEPHMSL